MASKLLECATEHHAVSTWPCAPGRKDIDLRSMVLQLLIPYTVSGRVLLRCLREIKLSCRLAEPQRPPKPPR